MFHCLKVNKEQEKKSINVHYINKKRRKKKSIIINNININEQTNSFIFISKKNKIKFYLYRNTKSHSKKQKITIISVYLLINNFIITIILKSKPASSDFNYNLYKFKI